MYFRNDRDDDPAKGTIRKDLSLGILVGRRSLYGTGPMLQSPWERSEGRDKERKRPVILWSKEAKKPSGPQSSPCRGNAGRNTRYSGKA